MAWWQRVIAVTLSTVLTASGFLATSSAQTPDGVAIQEGQKVAFLGDANTQYGWQQPAGYVQLVIWGLAANGIKVTPVPAGMNGHTSKDMLSRLDRDVINKKPDWLTISCGVNDVWHGDKGVALEPFKQNMTAMVDKAQAAGIHVMILTATVIGEDVDNANNQKLQDYNAFLRQLATQKNCLLADLNADMQQALADGEKAGQQRGHMLTSDGVHMNPHGYMLMAAGILKSFGLSQDQLAKAQEQWMGMHNAVTLQARRSITLREYQALEAAAAKQHCSVDDLLNNALSKDVDAMLKSDAPSKP